VVLLAKRHHKSFGNCLVLEDKLKKHCFVISPIGDADTEIRKRSDQVLKYIISPAVEQCGYIAIRGDQMSEPGLITTQIIQHIVDDPLVMADLTGRNPNVFYELALRHALRKPLIQMIAKGELLPFDVAGMRTIPIDHHDLDNVEEVREEIIRQIKSLEVNTDVVTPISIALNLQTLRESDNPEQRSLAGLLSTISELRFELSSIVTRLSDPSTLMPVSYLQEVLRSMESSTRDDMMIRDEMAYLINSLSTLITNSDNKQEAEQVQALKFIGNLQELLSKWSHRYVR